MQNWPVLVPKFPNSPACDNPLPRSAPFPTRFSPPYIALTRLLPLPAPSTAAPFDPALDNSPEHTKARLKEPGLFPPEDFSTTPRSLPVRLFFSFLLSTSLTGIPNGHSVKCVKKDTPSGFARHLRSRSDLTTRRANTSATPNATRHGGKSLHGNDQPPERGRLQPFLRLSKTSRSLLTPRPFCRFFLPGEPATERGLPRSAGF